MNCLVCNSDTKDFIKSKSFEIVKCTNCGLGITKNLEAHKGDYHRDDQYIAEEKLFKNIFQKRVDIIFNIKKSGEVLEIGCSTGQMLSLLGEKGFVVTGVELSKKSAQQAIGRGMDVLIGDFDLLRFNKKYDVIIFNHTLEHLSDPLVAVKKAASLLNKNGLLFIDLPNFGGFSAGILKSSWPLLLPQEHLWQFTEKSIDILLEKNNLKKIYVEKASGIWDYYNPCLGPMNSLLKLKKRFFMEILTAIPSWVVTKLNMGSDLMVIAKKDL